MKSKYMMGLMCAFCFGVIGKTALDELGYDVVGAAYADVAGMDYRDLRRDRDFKKAVKYIVNNCSVDIDGDYGSISC
jgi:hypothetical protein